MRFLLLTWRWIGNIVEDNIGYVILTGLFNYRLICFRRNVMNKLRSIVEAVLTITALLLVFSAGETALEYPVGQLPGFGTMIYLLSLILSVGYLHFMTSRLLLPLNEVPEPKKSEYRIIAMRQYSAGFFKGTVGAGYFFVLLHVFGFLRPIIEKHNHLTPSEIHNYLPFALMLIVLGELSKVRGLILHLLNNNKSS
jgi:hypothetical protein